MNSCLKHIEIGRVHVENTSNGKSNHTTVQPQRQNEGSAYRECETVRPRALPPVVGTATRLVRPLSSPPRTTILCAAECRRHKGPAAQTANLDCCSVSSNELLNRIGLVVGSPTILTPKPSQNAPASLGCCGNAGEAKKKKKNKEMHHTHPTETARRVIRAIGPFWLLHLQQMTAVGATRTAPYLPQAIVLVVVLDLRRHLRNKPRNDRGRYRHCCLTTLRLEKNHTCWLDQ